MNVGPMKLYKNCIIWSLVLNVTPPENFGGGLEEGRNQTETGLD